MSLAKIIDQSPDAAVFARNHLDYLQDAALISAGGADKHIAFREWKRWVSAERAISKHGPRKIYFVPVGDNLVKFVAKLEKVNLDVEEGSLMSLEMLALMVSKAKAQKEEMWSKKTNPMFYVVSDCQALNPAQWFSFTELRKLEGNTPISADFGYNYSLVHKRE